LVLARFKDGRYKRPCRFAKEFKLQDIIAIISLEVSLPKKICHMLERAHNVTNVVVKKFICAEKKCCYKVTILKTGISWDIGTVWYDHGRGRFH